MYYFFFRKQRMYIVCCSEFYFFMNFLPFSNALISQSGVILSSYSFISFKSDLDKIIKIFIDNHILSIIQQTL